MKDDEVDWDKLDLPPELAGKARTKVNRSPGAKQQFFTKFPRIWQERLAAIQASGSTYRVALHLLDKARRSAARPFSVVLANTGLRAAGVQKRGKAIALRELGGAGLITIGPRSNRSPVITVRFIA